MNLTINNNGLNYMRYVYGEVKKTEAINQPTLFDFTLAPTDGAFIKPARGNFVTLTTDSYGVVFTGYITNDPELTFIGSLPDGSLGYVFKFEATSEDYILSRSFLGMWPPFINTTQGAVLRALIDKLSGGLIDTSNVADGPVLARFVVDPQKYFKDIVGDFAKAAMYRFWVLSGKAYYERQDTTPAGLVIDGHDKHFTPSQLSITPVKNPVVNDVTVLGQVEPQNFMNEYFLGDGANARFPLISSVFGSDSAVLLDDNFGGSTIDTSKWTVYDTAAAYLQLASGYLNVLGGANDGAYAVHLDSANVIGLEGNVRLTHGQFDFVQASDGYVCGLWTQAPNSAMTGCLYALQCSKSGANTVIKPVLNGAVDSGHSITVNYSHRYVFRTLLNTRYQRRQLFGYPSLSREGVVSFSGANGIGDEALFDTYISEIDPVAGTLISETHWEHTAFGLSASTVYATYIPVASNDLHCSFTDTTISVPMQASLFIQPAGTSGFTKQLIGPNELDSTDGMAPIATISDSNSGWQTKSTYLGTPQYNPGQAALTFFKNSAELTTTVPQLGDVVWLQYQTAGAAIARVQDPDSVASEAAAWGDNGLRSVCESSLSPLPRTSQEAEWAAQAEVLMRSRQHYQGKYTCYNSYSVTSELRAGTILTFANLPSPFPAAIGAEEITQVVSTYLKEKSGAVNNEIIQFELTFGVIDTEASVLSQFTQQTDVFMPQDSAEIPKYQYVDSVGSVFVPDMNTPTFTSWDASNFYYSTNGILPPTGGGFEIRYSDSGWGCEDGKNLAGRTSSTTFSLPRNARSEIIYIKAYDARNLLTYSEDLTQWTATNATVANALDYNPDGDKSSISTVTASASASVVRATGNNCTAADVYTLSWWLKGTKGNTVSVVLGNLNTADNTSQAVTFTGKWQRVVVSHTIAATTTDKVSAKITSGAQTFQATRGMVEAGSTPTVYCKTLSTPYGALSRFASGIHVAWALPPAQPTAVIVASDPTKPLVNITLPNNLENVWGVEIRDSDNSTVLYNSKITSAGDTLSYTYANTSNKRALSFYVYTYNMLSPPDYSSAYNATLSLTGGTISGLAVNEANQNLTWTLTEATGMTGSTSNTTVEIASDAGFTSNYTKVSIQAQTLALSPQDFFSTRYFRVTPYDGLGAGTGETISHSYTPSAVTSLTVSQVVSVAPPATPTTPPTVPAAFVTVAADYQSTSFTNFAQNKERYTA